MKMNSVTVAILLFQLLTAKVEGGYFALLFRDPIHKTVAKFATYGYLYRLRWAAFSKVFAICVDKNARYKM